MRVSLWTVIILKSGYRNLCISLVTRKTLGSVLANLVTRLFDPTAMFVSWSICHNEQLPLLLAIQEIETSSYNFCYIFAVFRFRDILDESGSLDSFVHWTTRYGSG